MLVIKLALFGVTFYHVERLISSCVIFMSMAGGGVVQTFPKIFQFRLSIYTYTDVCANAQSIVESPPPPQKKIKKEFWLRS